MLWFVGRKSCASVCKVVQQISVSMENGEYDFDGTPEKRVCLLTYCMSEHFVVINTENCSLSISLTVTDQKPQKSFCLILVV